MGLPLTPPQTIGPFFHRALLQETGNVLTDTQTQGARIVIEGRVFDGERNPVSDALIEIWQADAAGRYGQTDCSSMHFHGFGRTGTDSDGRFRFTTIKPGAIRDDGDFIQAPHLNVAIFARGLLHHLVTRIYFAGEPLNTTDPVLSIVPDERRGTLIARESTGSGSAERHYSFEIMLQGEGETVFFDV